MPFSWLGPARDRVCTFSSVCMKWLRTGGSPRLAISDGLSSFYSLLLELLLGLGCGNKSTLSPLWASPGDPSHVAWVLVGSDKVRTCMCVPFVPCCWGAREQPIPHLELLPVNVGDRPNFTQPQRNPGSFGQRSLPSLVKMNPKDFPMTAGHKLMLSKAGSLRVKISALYGLPNGRALDLGWVCHFCRNPIPSISSHLLAFHKWPHHFVKLWNHLEIGHRVLHNHSCHAGDTPWLHIMVSEGSLMQGNATWLASEPSLITTTS